MDEEKIISKSKVLVDGDISIERLQTLIKLGIEEERLDYKNEYNLNSRTRTKDKVELVRDIVGMANTNGGYIVLGVHEITDESGKWFSPNGMSLEASTLLDTAALRQQIEAFISERLEIQYKLYKLGEYNDQSFGIIFVPPSPHSPIIFEVDGQYTDKSGPHNRNITLFCAGDIVVRKGSSTERAAQSDIRRLTSDMRQREKGRWTEEILGMRDLVQRLDQLIAVLSSGSSGVRESSQPNGVAPSNTDETLFFLSPGVIYNNTLNLLEANRNITLQRYINIAPSMFFANIENPQNNFDDNSILELRDNKLWPILDGLLAIGVTCVEYKQWDLLDTIQQAFYAISYKAEKSSQEILKRPTSPIQTVLIWQAIMLRVYALGAVLVSRSHWKEVRKLVQQEIEWDDYYRSHYWSRYFLVMASRARQLERQGWIPLTIAYVENQKWISDLFMSDKEKIIASICQFDFLQCVYSLITLTGELNDRSNPYPNFGLYYKMRIEPVVSKLASPGPLRETISSLDDKELATVIRELDRMAAKDLGIFTSWHEGGWSDQKITQFLDSH